MRGLGGASATSSHSVILPSHRSRNTPAWLCAISDSTGRSIGRGVGSTSASRPKRKTKRQASRKKNRTHPLTTVEGDSPLLDNKPPIRPCAQAMGDAEVGRCPDGTDVRAAGFCSVAPTNSCGTPTTSSGAGPGGVRRAYHPHCKDSCAGCLSRARTAPPLPWATSMPRWGSAASVAMGEGYVGGRNFPGVRPKMWGIVCVGVAQPKLSQDAGSASSMKRSRP